MKNFIKNLSSEFSMYKQKHSKNDLIAPPMVDGKIINSTVGLYLALYAQNRDIPSSFISSDQIKVHNINYDKSAEIDCIKVIEDYKVNHSVICKKKDITHYIPDFNFENPSKEQIKSIKELVQNRKLIAYPTNSSFKKALGDICILPIRNYTFKEKECLNINVLSNLNNLPKQVADFPLERDTIMDLLENYDNPLLKELVLFNIAIEENRFIDLSGFKQLEALDGIFHMNSQVFEITDTIKPQLKQPLKKI